MVLCKIDKCYNQVKSQVKVEGGSYVYCQN